jgi:hypothetical protein
VCADCQIKYYIVCVQHVSCLNHAVNDNTSNKIHKYHKEKHDERIHFLIAIAIANVIIFNNTFIIMIDGPGELSRRSDSLRAGRSGNRGPVRGRDFPNPSRPVMAGTQPPV